MKFPLYYPSLKKNTLSLLLFPKNGLIYLQKILLSIPHYHHFLKTTMKLIKSQVLSFPSIKFFRLIIIDSNRYNIKLSLDIHIFQNIKYICRRLKCIKLDYEINGKKL